VKLRLLMPSVLAVAAGAGCTQQQVTQAENAVASAAPGVVNAIATAAPKFAADALIVARVESDFVQIDPASALHVAVASHGGTLTLSGKVRSGAIEARFVSAAKSVDGVKSVSARLAVDGSLPNASRQIGDFALVAAVRANLAAQGGLNGVQVDVKASQGTVTLGGRVATRAIRDTLVAAAKKTAGVKTVVDALVVGT
jgi:hyperosmotically inducible protein